MLGRSASQQCITAEDAFHVELEATTPRTVSETNCPLRWDRGDPAFHKLDSRG